VLKLALDQALRGSGLSAAINRRGEKLVRPRRSCEHAMLNEDDWCVHGDHVHDKPVKHGHLRRLEDLGRRAFEPARCACSPP
jgi:hypothetical protein